MPVDGHAGQTLSWLCVDGPKSFPQQRELTCFLEVSAQEASKSIFLETIDEPITRALYYTLHLVDL